MSEQGKLPKTLTINQKGTDIGFLDNLGIFVPIHTKELAEEAVRRYNSHDKLVEANRWIPVSERLPKDKIYVLMVGMPNTYANIGCYNEKECIWQRYGEKIRWEVTHWRPIVLPEQVKAALEGVK